MSNHQQTQAQTVTDHDSDLQKQVIGNWKIVDLPEIVIVAPESKYDVLAKFDVKLFRFKNDMWNQRGQGQLKFIQHIQSKETVLLMRQKKTFFIRANHFLRKNDQLCVLKKSLEHQDSWEWSAKDISDGNQNIEKFSVKLQTPQKAQQFQQQFQACCEISKSLNMI